MSRHQEKELFAGLLLCWGRRGEAGGGCVARSGGGLVGDSDIITFYNFVFVYSVQKSHLALRSSAHVLHNFVYTDNLYSN